MASKRPSPDPPEKDVKVAKRRCIIPRASPELSFCVVGVDEPAPDQWHLASIEDVKENLAAVRQTLDGLHMDGVACRLLGGKIYDNSFKYVLEEGVDSLSPHALLCRKAITKMPDELQWYVATTIVCALSLWMLAPRDGARLAENAALASLPLLAMPLLVGFTQTRPCLADIRDFMWNLICLAVACKQKALGPYLLAGSGSLVLLVPGLVASRAGLTRDDIVAYSMQRIWQLGCTNATLFLLEERSMISGMNRFRIQIIVFTFVPVLQQLLLSTRGALVRFWGLSSGAVQRSVPHMEYTKGMNAWQASQYLCDRFADPTIHLCCRFAMHTFIYLGICANIEPLLRGNQGASGLSTAVTS